MRIAYDLRYASDHFVGIGTYAYRLFVAMLEQGAEHQFDVMWNPGWAAERYGPAALRTHPRVTWSERGNSPLSPWFPIGTGSWLRAIRPDVYFSPYHLLPMAGGCPRAVTLHDVRPLRFPGELPAARRALFRWSVRRAARAEALFTVSEFSRSEILACLAVGPGRVHLARPGVSAALRSMVPSRPREVPDGPFALVVGDNRPHKNLRLLAGVWRTLGAQAGLTLVGAGPRLERHPGLAELATQAAAPHVIELGRVTEEELEWLYRHATLALCPSVYEGFSSPLAEALDHGAATIASDIPVLRETGADAAVFCDPQDPGAWVRAVRELARAQEARARLAVAGRARAAEMRYEDTARSVCRVLTALVATNRTT